MATKRYVFGQSFTYQYYPQDTEGFIVPSADAPTIYLYDRKPTRADAATGAGSPLQTISSWSTTTDGDGREFTVAVIDDPEPNGGVDRYTYYLAINYTLETGEQSQLDIRALPLMRVDSHSTIVGVSQADLQEVYEDIDTIASSARQDSAISLAEALIRQEFENASYEWLNIWEPQDLKRLVAFKALEIIMIEQVRDTGDDWNLRLEEYRLMREELQSQLKFAYSLSRENEPEALTTFGTGMRLIR